MIRAVCLDIDDTLVDFTTAATAALNVVLGAVVDEVAWASVNEFHYGRYLAGEIDFPGMQRARLAAIFAEMDLAVPADVAALEARRAVELRSRLRCFDDVAACLAELRAQGLALAVLTNSEGPHQRRKLAAVGLDRHFDQLVISGETGCVKPDAEIFHVACQMLGTEPAQTVHVGDRLHTDACGARDAGLHGVWLDRRGVEGNGVGCNGVGCNGVGCNGVEGNGVEGNAVVDGVHRIQGLAQLPQLVRSLRRKSLPR